MNQSISLYLSALREVIWQQPDDFSFPDRVSQSWLLEQGSLSRVLEAQCQQLSVEILYNKLVEAEQLQGDEIALLSDEACLLRQVVLRGDQQPWVLGRTLIPQSSMLHEAACAGNLTNAERAIAHGANVNAQRAGSGLTALHLAVRKRSIKFIEVLLEARADPRLLE